MMEDSRKDDLDKELEDLDFFQPSMRFSKNVVEKVKLNAGLIKPERGPIYWLPRIFAGSALAVFVLVLGLLFIERSTLSETVVSEQMHQVVLTITGSLVGVAVLLGMDRLFRKLLLR